MPATPDPPTYRVVFYPTERSVTPEPADLTWGEVVEFLSAPRRTDCAPCPGHACQAKRGPSWSPVDADRRAKDAVRSVSLLVLDLDGRSDLPHPVLYRHVLHATHSPAGSRLVVPLSRPVPGADWPAVYPRLVAALGMGPYADPQCKDAGHLYFQPSKPHGESYLVKVGESDRLLDSGEASIRRSAGEATTAIRPAADVKVLAHAADWLREHGPAVEGQGGDAHTYAVGAFLLNDLALTHEEAWPLALEWNRTCQPPWELADLVTKLRNGERYATGERGARRFDLELAQEFGTSELLATQPAATGGCAGYGAPLLTDEGAETGPTWVAAGVLPAGVPQVIVGHPKSRKTLLAELLGLCVAAGLPWLGRHVVTRGRVLLVLKEDSPAETRRRLWRLARGLGFEPPDVRDWLRVECEAPFRFDNVPDLKRMAQTIDEWRPSVVVLDSLSRMHGQDENSVTGMRVVVAPWAELCSAYSCAVVAIHHLRKPWGEEGGSFGTRMRGTGDLHAVVRNLVGVEREAESDVSSVHVEGNLPGYPDPFQVAFSDSQDLSSKGYTKLSYAGEVVRKTLSQGLRELMGGK